MKIVQLNAVCGVGSTGGITVAISRMLTEHNIENYILYTNGKHGYKLGINYSNSFLVKSSALKAKLFGNYGFNSRKATKNLIQLLNMIKPDIVHLHNIHGHDLNLEYFFKYLKKTRVRVIWTFHDCWAFTGYCMHFDILKCTKWQTKCGNCPQAKQYSFFVDRSEELFLKKKQLFTAIEDMTIVSPSNWLAELARHSFLNKYRIVVINNGIDLDIFRPRNNVFKKEYGIEDKYIVLGVPKGNLEPFEKLSTMLNEKYKLVLVGLNQKERAKLPKNIIGLPHTVDRVEMAQLFTAADVYINTTLEDTFPTVNLESLACGTPVITFNTGGSPEAVDDNTGIVVEKGNIAAVNDAICDICTGRDRSVACIERARRLYNANDRFEDYYELYTRGVQTL